MDLPRIRTAPAEERARVGDGVDFGRTGFFSTEEFRGGRVEPPLAGRARGAAAPRHSSGGGRAHGARAAGVRPALLANLRDGAGCFSRGRPHAHPRPAQSVSPLAGEAGDAGAFRHRGRGLGVPARRRASICSNFPGGERGARAKSGPFGVLRTRGAVQRDYREGDLKTVLITGATGDVGTHLSRELAGKYELRLSDKRPLKAKNFIKADISKMADALRITKGVDAIVHLGGYSVEGSWEAILQANIVGCYNIFEAARRNGVKRIVFPTSNHATGFYRRDQTIDHRVYPKPDSRYGVSKVFGEALGSLYADKYGMQFLMIRIGNVNPVPLDKRRLSLWISPRDIALPVSIGIYQPGIKFEIVYGVSDNKRNWYDNSNAVRLGYRSQDDSEPYAEEILRKEKPSADAIAEAHQGGIFCTAEAVPNPAAPKKKGKSTT